MVRSSKKFSVGQCNLRKLEFWAKHQRHQWLYPTKLPRASTQYQNHLCETAQFRLHQIVSVCWSQTDQGHRFACWDMLVDWRGPNGCNATWAFAKFWRRPAGRFQPTVGPWAIGCKVSGAQQLAVGGQLHKGEIRRIKKSTHLASTGFVSFLGPFMTFYGSRFVMMHYNGYQRRKALQ